MSTIRKMFHVEHRFPKHVLTICFVICQLSCGISKPKIEIQDFAILSDGMVVGKNKSVNAFVFENNLQNKPFQDFLVMHFKTTSLSNRIISFKINQIPLKMLLYDQDDFERFFGVNNFVAQNQENITNKLGNINKFVAISVVTEDNQDCLDQNNLLQQTVIDYLQNLKKLYLKSND